MAYEGREKFIKRLELEIVEAKKLVLPAKEKMIKHKFDRKYIKIYNSALSKVGVLRKKLEYEKHYNKPVQYMDEVKIPNNIII